MAESKNRETPGKPEELDMDEAGGPQRSPSERAELIRNPNLNQADNWRGSQDQTQGSQTGNDVDQIPDT
jgi:hypothetical protein